MMMYRSILVLWLSQYAFGNPLELFLSRVERDVNPADVKFYLFTKTVSALLIDDLPNESIDKAKTTVFFIHGYLNNVDQPYFKFITEAFLKNGGYNIIHVDWRKPAKLLYVTSAKNTNNVGEIIAQFIVTQNLDLKKVHVSGHSLGSHVSGFAGKKIQELTGRKIHRITGLDPAGPYFRNEDITPKDRLSPDDAKIVVAMHTDYNLLGYENPLGRFDIYFNGGASQPYCDNRNSTICNHMLVLDYFAEFVNTKLSCKMCNSLEDYKNNKCSSANKIDVDFEDVEKTKGLCFVDTGAERPFL